MIPLLLLASAAIGTIGKISSKTCSNIVSARSNRLRYFLYLTLVGVVACLVFFVLNGFKISFTPKTLYFAIAFSSVCVISMLCSVRLFKLSNISGAVVLSSFGSLIATSAAGFFVFHEEISVRTLLKIGIMTVPSALTFFQAGRKEKERKKSINKGVKAKLAALILLITANGCASTVIIKLYNTASNVTSINSMFFLTNAVIALGTSLVFAFFALKGRTDEERKAQLKDSISLFRPLPLLAIAGNTTASNLGSLIGAILIKYMDISVYTPVSSAINILAGVFASFIFRERHDVLFYISALLALVAVVI